MIKVVELEDVYLEYPEEVILTSEEETKEEKEVLESYTTRLSKEELMRRLDETDTLHL